MKNLFIAVIFVIATTSCVNEEDEKSWSEKGPGQYTCTDAQFELVEKQYALCVKSTYFSSFCFREAMRSNCTERKNSP